MNDWCRDDPSAFHQIQIPSSSMTQKPDDQTRKVSWASGSNHNIHKGIVKTQRAECGKHWYQPAPNSSSSHPLSSTSAQTPFIISIHLFATISSYLNAFKMHSDGASSLRTKKGRRGDFNYPTQHEMKESLVAFFLDVAEAEVLQQIIICDGKKGFFSHVFEPML